MVAVDWVDYLEDDYDCGNDYANDTDYSYDYAPFEDINEEMKKVFSQRVCQTSTTTIILKGL